MKPMVMLFIGMCAISAIAQDQVGRRGWFAGVEAGYAELNQSDLGDSFGWEDTGLALTVSGGYQFNPYFGLELGYMRLDEMEVGSPDYHLTIAPEGFKFMVFGRVPLGDFALKGKAGYFDNDKDGEVVNGGTIYSPSVDGGFGWELGAEYQVAPRWFVGLSGGKYELDWYTIWGPERDIFVLQGGVRYRF